MEIKILLQGVHNIKETTDKKLKAIVDPICSTVVLIKGKHSIIVDPGHYGFEDKILKNLKKEGLRPEDIDYVLVTHLHPDHFLGAYMFRGAKTVINYGILDIGKGTYYNDQDFVKVPGIERIKTPGHTAEHMSVVVKADKTYVIAGDAIRYDMLKKGFANEQEKGSAKKILDMADIIIPGHGPIIEGKKLEEFKRLVK